MLISIQGASPMFKYLQHIDRNIKSLLLGILLASVALVAGQITSSYYSNLGNDLITKCMLGNKKPVTSEIPPWEKYNTLVCDLNTLKSRENLVGIQEKIVEASSNENEWRWKSNLFSASLLGIFAIPYIWYFLLRRIRELSDAIFGK